MLGMIPLLMLFIQQYRACLEGNCDVCTMMFNVMSCIFTVHTRLSALALSLDKTTPLLKLEKWLAQRLWYRKWWKEVLLSPKVGWICCTTHSTCIVVGLDVKEVAHDIQRQVAKYVISSGLTNSFDTWHGIMLYHHDYVLQAIHYVINYRNKECVKIN